MILGALKVLASIPSTATTTTEMKTAHGPWIADKVPQRTFQRDQIPMITFVWTSTLFSCALLKGNQNRIN